MAVAVPARLSVMQLRERLRRVGALSERQQTRLAHGGCLLLALLLRAPHLSTPLDIDEGGIAYIAQRWPGGYGSLYGSYWPARAGDHSSGNDLVHSARPAPGRETGAVPR
jgi:hypothetical protein